MDTPKRAVTVLALNANRAPACTEETCPVNGNWSVVEKGVMLILEEDEGADWYVPKVCNWDGLDG